MLTRIDPSGKRNRRSHNICRDPSVVNPSRRLFPHERSHAHCVSGLHPLPSSSRLCDSVNRRNPTCLRSRGNAGDHSITDGRWISLHHAHKLLTAGQFFHSYILKPHARLIEVIGLYFVDLPGFPHLLKLLAQSDAGIGLPLQTDAVPKLACTGKHAAGRQMQSAKLVRAKVAARNPTTKDDGSEEESRSEL